MTAATLLLTLAALLPAKRAITIDDLERIARATSLDLAPDGRSIAYTRGAEWMLIDIARPASPVFRQSGSSPRFSPDGGRIAYYSGKPAQVWIRERSGSKPLQLTEHAGGVDLLAPLAWSPDGRMILFTSARNELLSIDISTRRTLRLTEDGRYYARSWSPDGRAITAVRPHARKGAAPPRADLLAIDVASKRQTEIAVIDLAVGMSARQATAGGPRWSPDGSRIAYLAAAVPYGPATLFVAPLKGGGPVAPGLDRQVDAFEWSADSKSLWAVYPDGPTSAIARLDVNGTAAQPLLMKDARRTHTGFNATGAAAWIQSDDSAPAAIWMKSPDSEARGVLNLNPEIAEWDLGSQQVIRWRSRDGAELWGALVLPPGFVSGKRLPVIVNPYGNAAAMNEFKSFAMFSNQSHAAAGYALFYPHIRAVEKWPAARGFDFVRKVEGADAAEIALGDLLSGVDALIERGIADPERLGLWGFSSGATTANYLLPRTTRFRAAVSCAGIADFANYMLQIEPEDQTQVDMMRGRTPSSDPDAYRAHSALHNLDKIRTPLLVFAGARDRLMLESQMLANGLRRLGRDVEFVRYPDQGHVFSGEALRDYNSRVVRFFARHLLTNIEQDGRAR